MIRWLGFPKTNKNHQQVTGNCSTIISQDLCSVRVSIRLPCLISVSINSAGTGWLLDLDKATIWLDTGFITWHCVIRSLTGIWYSSQSNYCRVSCDEKELETIVHLLCNCPAFSKLRLRTIGKGFFVGLNLVSRANIQALHRFISCCIVTVRLLSPEASPSYIYKIFGFVSFFALSAPNCTIGEVVTIEALTD